MARRRSQQIHRLKAKLIARLTDGFHRPGQRFLSNRAVAKVYRVSYQTAHRIIAELEAEGYLNRRSASGTYVAGRRMHLKSVALFFHPRARREGSFGGYLLKLLADELKNTGIKFQIHYTTRPANSPVGCYPVLWEVPRILQRLKQRQQYALLLNDRPSPGFAASFIDAVATDDFSAGACAAQVLAESLLRGSKQVVVAGPADDERSKNRLAGFLARQPNAKVIYAGGWYFEHSARIAKRVMALEPKGVFCVNDRLASALLAFCDEGGLCRPIIIGHDNAPSAEEWHLTTIGIPWEEMVRAARWVIKSRLEGDAGPARQIILAQRPVYRLTHRLTVRLDGIAKNTAKSSMIQYES